MYLYFYVWQNKYVRLTTEWIDILVYKQICGYGASEEKNPFIILVFVSVLVDVTKNETKAEICNIPLDCSIFFLSWCFQIRKMGRYRGSREGRTVN